jgi:Tfp pilus assembly protein PilF
MSSRKNAFSASRLLGIACALLIAATGCVTSEPAPTQEHRLKQAKSHFDIGLDHMNNGRFAVALRELRIAENFDPKNPKIQIALAEAYMHKGKDKEAEAHLLRALEIHPEYHDARLNLAGLYLLTGKWQDAARHSQILIEDPTFPGVWRAFTNLAVAQLGQDQLVEARENLEMAIEFNPTYWPALLSRGILENEEGRQREAIGFFELMLQQNSIPSARAEANYHLAEAYVSLGDRKKAVRHLKTAVAQTPGGQWGKKSEEYLQILR